MTILNLEQKPLTRGQFQRHRFSSEIKRQEKDLQQLNNWRGLLAFSEDALVFGLGISMAEQFKHPIVYLMAIILIGSRMRALATILHESAHETLAANRFLNNLLGYIAGFAILQVREPYTISHRFWHHRYLGNANLDPDFKFHLDEGLYESMTPCTFVLKYIIGVILLTRVPKTVFYLFRDRLFPLQYNNKKQKEKVLRDSILFLVVWVLLLIVITITHQWLSFLYFWVVPYFTTFQVVNWFCELGEHYPKLTQSNVDLYMSRNRLGTWLERFLFGMHNEYLHLEHHLNPAIPFWNLPKSRMIHLQDPAYREVDRQTGGLFTRRGDASSAIEEMLNYHRRRQ